MALAASPRAEVPAGLPPDRALLFRAVALQNDGKAAEAKTLFEQVLQQQPADAVALYSLGVILLQQPDPVRALALLDDGVKRVQGFAPLWFVHGVALQAAGRREDALQSYDRALQIQPDYTEVLINSGVLLREMLRHGQALERFHRVLQLQPDNENALSNAAVMLAEFKRSGEAVAMFQRLLQLNPDYDYGLGSLCFERLHACDWTDFDDTARRIVQGVRDGRRVTKSFALMAIADSPEDQQRCARIFSAQRYAAAAAPLWTGERYRHDRIRVAYVSPDLREHPVGHLMAGILERHDHRRFETIGISIGIDDGSPLRARIARSLDRFVDCKLMGSRQIAELMRSMEVDIAVDLAGFTADSRSEVFAQRPAPVQVNYLGYPGTLGCAYMDYLVADRHVIPPEHRGFYDEKVVYLPDQYLPCASDVPIAATPTRAACGLPEQGFVFCSFNHDYKISPAIFGRWMRLLLAVPDSVLWLQSRQPIAQANLRAQAAAQGVDPARLVFAERVPSVADHLARYRVADLFLDTHPYNAHTTAADALMAGLPVLTMMGEAFPSRVAGSLLHAAGMPELITRTPDAYEALALALARDPERLAALKLKLARQRGSAPLFDPALLCRNLEAVWTAMWRRQQLGDAADAL